jgi:hypothetical protein
MFTLIFFIPCSLFGIWYKVLSPSYSGSLWALFTAESLFTATIPLTASILMDGILISFKKINQLDTKSPEYEIFRDALIFSIVVLMIMFFIISLSLVNNSIILAIISFFIPLMFWVLICSSKDEFTKAKPWSSTGCADEHSADSLTNGIN